MRIRRGWLITILAVVVGIVLLRVTLFRPHPIEVEIATVDRGMVEDAVTNSQAGTVKSRLRARVGAERAGRVLSIPHREGSKVHRGDVLLQLDPSSAQVQLDLALRDRDALRATLESARAATTLARQDHARAEQLRNQSVISEEQMDQAKSRLDGANAELRAAQARSSRTEAAVNLARDELKHLRVVAPFDGVVTSRFVEVGEPVIPGQAVLEVMSPDRLYVSAPIDEIDIGRLSNGLPARVTLDPYPGVVWRGVVSRVSSTVNDIKEQNRTLEIEVDLAPDPAHPQPKPGTSADVQIILDRHDHVLRVPTFSVIEGKRVLLANGKKAVSRDVKVGIKNWEWTEITDGLKEGESVITNLDRQGLKAGVVVAPKPRGDANPPGTAEARTRGSKSKP